VKVLHRNEEQAPKHWKQRCLCGSCSSTLEVEETDTRRYRPGPGEAFDMAVFECPVCQAYSMVDMPKVIKERLVEITEVSGVISAATIVATR